MDKYVYDGIEVEKTGRSAVRTVANKQLHLVEIKPVDQYADWKKWVKETDLYKIVEN
jgi:hypothetical protein